MGKSSPSPPAAPDPVKTANAQAAANKETAIANANINQVNQVTPYGNLTYSQRGTASDGTPQYTATTTLSPAQQQLLDLSNQAGIKFGQTANNQLNSVSDKLSQPLDFSSLGPAPTANEATRQDVLNSIIARNQPQMEKDRAALETRLANQGIGYGTDAYNSAMDNYNRSVNDFRLGADTQAGNEMSRLFGLESTARNQGINEMVQQRQIPLNELAAMLTGSQVQNPNFVNTPQTQIAPTDLIGATYGSYNGQMQGYNSQVANKNAQTQGTMGLLGSLAMAGAMAF